jgi:D-glycero-D-manno-heptose 1,7-bisphosphate phosphatase
MLVDRAATRAVFLDRDGVLIEDMNLLVHPGQIRILPGVAEAIVLLKEAGFVLLVVSNQPVVARGLIDESQVRTLQQEVEARLVLQGCARLDGFYFCPHHPKATLPAYRQVCECRKPRPGLLLRAAAEHGVDLAGSFMVGDRPTDLVAGERAGCRTVWVETGQHLAPPIETGEPLPLVRPDHVCADLLHAARWILGRRG